MAASICRSLLSATPARRWRNPQAWSTVGTMSTLPSRRDIIRMIGASAAAAFARSVGGAVQLRLPSGAVIRTVLEDLPPEALAGGATLFHEHLSVGADFMPKAMSLFRTLLGPDAVLPPIGPPEQQRLMQDLAVMTEFYPPEIARGDESEITQELLRQANAEPIGAFGEIGTWDVMTPDERKVFRAVGKAHLETNLPIFTHTNMGKGALEQLDVLESVGVKPQRVAIGHLGGLKDPKAEVPKAICKRGAYVGFDRQGGPDDSSQIPAVLALLVTRTDSCSRPIFPSPPTSSAAAAPGTR